ncbi:RhoGAP domain containing protein [Histomonas meleagridis]|uniref:RhoGAP domain containing protein n=1 Tax=Histomonas meleagridis TaxID=135588 RepID=UPI003559B9C4|nr:RhoGAP domain containing protein [Histomonas meleagridis]KAH0802631.1 RhoGAP domain containing protein [Histomonas meleagridis]
MLESRATGNEILFYAYLPKSNGKRYFHDPISNKVFWEVPDDSNVVDGNTFEKINIDSTNTKKEITRAKSALVLNDKKLVTNTKIRTRTFNKKMTLASTETCTQKIDHTILPPYLPSSIKEDQNLISFEDFAHKNFRYFQSKKKKSTQSAEYLSYNENVNLIPFLNIDSKHVKDAVKSFEFIINYTKNMEYYPVMPLVRIASKSNDLVDEIYTQLIRQTYFCKFQNIISRGWELILVMCTLFLPSESIRPMIKSFLASSSFSAQKQFAKAAQLSYIRFMSLCDKGSNFRDLSDSVINNIPNHTKRCPFLFGSSLSEVFFVQNQALINSPVPIFIHKLCETLLKRGITKADGAFQVQADKNVLNELVQKVDAEYDIFESTEILDLASLLKKLMADFPQPLLEISSLRNLNEDQYVEYVLKLPKIYRNTLAYIIGFIRRFCTGSGKELSVFGMIFGLNVMHCTTLNPAEMKDFAAMSSKVMLKLLKDWDVSDIYPIQRRVTMQI